MIPEKNPISHLPFLLFSENVSCALSNPIPFSPKALRSSVLPRGFRHVRTNVQTASQRTRGWQHGSKPGFLRESPGIPKWKWRCGVLGDDYVGAYPRNFQKSPNAKELRIINCWVSGSFSYVGYFLDRFGEGFLWVAYIASVLTPMIPVTNEGFCLEFPAENGILLVVTVTGWGGSSHL